jgi:hypothetical protein
MLYMDSHSQRVVEKSAILIAFLQNLTRTTATVQFVNVIIAQGRASSANTCT